MFFRPKKRELPSLKDVYDKNKAGQFVDHRSEQIYNEVVARIEDLQTKLTQQSLDGIPVTLSTPEMGQIYKEVIFFKSFITIIHLV